MSFRNFAVLIGAIQIFALTAPSVYAATPVSTYPNTVTVVRVGQTFTITPPQADRTVSLEKYDHTALRLVAARTTGATFKALRRATTEVDFVSTPRCPARTVCPLFAQLLRDQVTAR